MLQILQTVEWREYLIATNLIMYQSIPNNI